MKHKDLALAAGLSLLAFSVNSIAENLATPPTPGNKPGAIHPCGNSGPTDPPSCPTCADKDSTGHWIKLNYRDWQVSNLRSRILLPDE